MRFAAVHIGQGCQVDDDSWPGLIKCARRMFIDGQVGVNVGGVGIAKARNLMTNTFAMNAEARRLPRYVQP
jgi:hypothetical protein